MVIRVFPCVFSPALDAPVEFDAFQRATLSPAQYPTGVGPRDFWSAGTQHGRGHSTKSDVDQPEPSDLWKILVLGTPRHVETMCD